MVWCIIYKGKCCFWIFYFSFYMYIYIYVYIYIYIHTHTYTSYRNFLLSWSKTCEKYWSRNYFDRNVSNNAKEIIVPKYIYNSIYLQQKYFHHHQVLRKAVSCMLGHIRMSLGPRTLLRVGDQSLQSCPTLQPHGL